MGRRLDEFRRFERGAQAWPALCALACVLALGIAAAFYLGWVGQSTSRTPALAEVRRLGGAALWLTFSAFWARLAWRGWRRR